VRSYGSKEPVELSVVGEWAGVGGVVVASSGASEVQGQDGRPALIFKVSGTWDEKAFFVGDWREKEPAADPGRHLYGKLGWEPLQKLRAELSSTAILQFESAKLAAPSYSEERIPRIRPDGAGLASVLANLKLSQDEIFERIGSALREVVPAVRRVRIERAQLQQDAHTINEVGVRKVWGDQLVLDMQGAKGVAAHAVGEGTLMALGLLTVLLAPPFPRLVLLDDIELKLHPVAQARLIEVLRVLQKSDAGLQVLATSHSPFILNYLDPKEVRMTFLAENGFARCEKLTAHPEFEKWKDLMSPGEFWSTVGESWLEKVGEPSAHK
jgi:hypothetical protein